MVSARDGISLELDPSGNVLLIARMTQDGTTSKPSFLISLPLYSQQRYCRVAIVRYLLWWKKKNVFIIIFSLWFNVYQNRFCSSQRYVFTSWINGKDNHHVSSSCLSSQFKNSCYSYRINFLFIKRNNLCRWKRRLSYKIVHNRFLFKKSQYQLYMNRGPLPHLNMRPMYTCITDSPLLSNYYSNWTFTKVLYLTKLFCPN